LITLHSITFSEKNFFLKIINLREYSAPESAIISDSVKVQPLKL